MLDYEGFTKAVATYGNDQKENLQVMWFAHRLGEDEVTWQPAASLQDFNSDAADSPTAVDPNCIECLEKDGYITLNARQSGQLVKRYFVN